MRVEGLRFRVYANFIRFRYRVLGGSWAKIVRVSVLPCVLYSLYLLGLKVQGSGFRVGQIITTSPDLPPKP